MIVVLTGGTGGAKFVDGLRRVVPAEDLTIIVNTGDDDEWWGLYVSPDIDSITYILADMLSTERGWGVRGDTFHCLRAMKDLGEPAWFSVGDRDLAVHLMRTKLMSEGCTLSEVTRTIAERFGLRSRILPMSDQRVRTRIVTPAGELSFEEYFVKRRFRDAVNSVRFEGAAEAMPAPGVRDAIAAAEAVLIAPSNPVTSIGPILAVPGIRQALAGSEAPVVAVSPIVADKAVSGPAATLMEACGWEASLGGVAAAYAGFLDTLVAHSSDAAAAEALASGRLQVHCAPILLNTISERTQVASTALNLAYSGKKAASAVEAP